MYIKIVMFDLVYNWGHIAISQEGGGLSFFSLFPRVKGLFPIKNRKDEGTSRTRISYKQRMLYILYSRRSPEVTNNMIIWIYSQISAINKQKCFHYCIFRSLFLFPLIQVNLTGGHYYLIFILNQFNKVFVVCVFALSLCVVQPRGVCFHLYQ